MKKILLVYNESAKREYGEFLELLMQHEFWKHCVFEEVELKNAWYTSAEQARISNCEADGIISLNMAGFQYKTLLDNYLYNILPIRQMHLILNKLLYV